jgi:synaptic vesicle membrane protein VAT-1
MRAIQIQRAGDTSVLKVVELPDPLPAAGEVRVRTAFAGLNFAEVMARKGLYPDAPKTPCVMGYEVAGTVEAIGRDVTGVSVGDRVTVLCRFGGHAELVCVPEAQVFRIPDSMSFEQAAALPVNYLTAYHMLFRVHRLLPGDTVLVHMAAGGVGTAALQLCRTVSDVTTIGTASAAKHEFVRSHGCDHAIDYRTMDYVHETMRLTGGLGVDLVLDALGGPDWKKGYSLLRAGGLLIAFGWANMSQGAKRNLLKVAAELVKQPIFSAASMMSDNRGVAGVNMGHLWHESERIREEAMALFALFEQGKIAPHVDSVYPFSEAAAAHTRLESGKSVGKVLLQPG